MPDEPATGSEDPGDEPGRAQSAPEGPSEGRRGRRHLTRHCPACHRLQRLALILGREGKNPPSA
ncbi:DUF6274 family protein [Streptomyces sp. ADI91-18]|uniref:DUF6274 family protein n=1 Tax=Streptomyces sp. ADI91-18 TaxID=1522755 RepID=UPI001F14E536|nr:DUF6274 family protein [Streptomyces sp. ADI91-18]